MQCCMQQYPHCRALFPRSECIINKQLYFCCSLLTYDYILRRHSMQCAIYLYLKLLMNLFYYYGPVLWHGSVVFSGKACPKLIPSSSLICCQLYFLFTFRFYCYFLFYVYFTAIFSCLRQALLLYFPACRRLYCYIFLLAAGFTVILPYHPMFYYYNSFLIHMIIALFHANRRFYDQILSQDAC